MNQKPEVGGYFGSILTSALAAIQTNEIFQIIEIALACISFLVSISYTIYKWYKRATSDDSDGGKKITKNEVSELADGIKNIKKDKEE